MISLVFKRRKFSENFPSQKVFSWIFEVRTAALKPPLLNKSEIRGVKTFPQKQDGKKLIQFASNNLLMMNQRIAKRVFKLTNFYEGFQE